MRPTSTRALRTALRDGIIGLSCGTPQEAHAADPALVDYIGVGPAFATPSKADAGLPIGLSGIRAVAEATRLPCAAIGGIDATNVARIRETGAQMAAVLSALAGSDPEGAARQLVARWNGAPS